MKDDSLPLLSGLRLFLLGVKCGPHPEATALGAVTLRDQSVCHTSDVDLQPVHHQALSGSNCRPRKSGVLSDEEPPSISSFFLAVQHLQGTLLATSLLTLLSYLFDHVRLRQRDVPCSSATW